MDALIDALEADPSRARRRIAAVVVIAAIGIAIYLGRSRPEVVDRDSPEHALDDDSCATAVDDARLLPATRFLTPTTYSNPGCAKAFVVGLSLPEPPSTFAITVKWADPWPRTEVQCTGAYIAMKLFRANRSDGHYVSTSQWKDGVCRYGQLVWSSAALWDRIVIGAGETSLEIPSSWGGEVKLVITARTPRRSTQPIEVSYRRGL
jgi:hypothetical protein